MCITLSTLAKWQPLAIFLSGFGTIFLAFVAIFQDRLRALVFCPKLDLEQGPFYPDSERVPITDEETGKFLGDACYLQIRIRNKGHSTAEMVEVFVAKLEKETNGIFCKVEDFYPLNLKWRHYDKVFLPRISPKTTRDCTLGRIVDPKRKGEVGDDDPALQLPPDRSPFRLELAVVPNTRNDLLPLGKYRLFVEIGASNSRRIKKRTIGLEFTGEWLPKPIDMAKATPI